jgi:hypothetical protein
VLQWLVGRAGWREVGALAWLLVALACSDLVQPQGVEGGHCYPNDTCNAGLTCASNLCVIVDGGDADESFCTGARCGDDGGATTQPARDGGAGDGGDVVSGGAGRGDVGAGGGGGARAGAGGSSAGSGGSAADPCPGEPGAGVCLPQACGSDVCDHPPPSVCSGASTLQTFAFQGTCSGTQCTYPSVSVACPDGCVAGQCQGSGQTLHPWAGLYRGSYSGTESGTLLVVVDPDGTVTAYVTSPRGQEVYTGVITANGELAVDGMLLGTYAISFGGSMSGDGPNRMGTGTWSAPAVGASGTWQTDEINPWAGHYVGSFSGGLSGTLDVATADDGAVTVLAQGMMFTGSVRIDGTLDVTGALTGGVAVSYAGSMSGLAPMRTGNGAWTSSLGLSGSWTITED